MSIIKEIIEFLKAMFGVGIYGKNEEPWPGDLFEFKGKNMVETAYRYDPEENTVSVAVRIKRNSQDVMQIHTSELRTANEEDSINSIWQSLKEDHKELMRHLKKPKADGTWGGLLS